MSQKLLAPVVIFAYNRPEHLKLTLDALRANHLASDTEIFIYADGPKLAASEDELLSIEKVRRLIRELDGFKAICAVERTTNLGLAANIVSGVSEVTKRFGKAIVLEDDIVTAPGFLSYMNDALILYEQDHTVMHISGYMFPVQGNLPLTFFCKQTTCWGWATWERAWRHYENDPNKILGQLDKLGNAAVKKADFDGTRQFLNQLEANASGRLVTWAVKWQFSVFFRDGLCLHPARSLVQNIGNDGSGTNCEPSDRFDTTPSDFIKIERIKISDYKPVYSLLKKYYGINRKNTVLRLFLPWIPEALKSKVKAKFRKTDYKKNDLPTLRYVPAKIEFRGKVIQIVDSASFRFTVQKFFTDEICKVHTKSDKPFIIDTNANIGLALIYFRTKFPKAEILAFEPDPLLFKVTAENLASFGLEDIRVLQKLPWDKNGILSYQCNGVDYGQLMGYKESAASLKVDAVRLREYLSRKVDLLKIQLNNSDINALSDCADMLYNVDQIFVEYNSYTGDSQGLGDILKVISEAKFRYVIHRTGVYDGNPFSSINDYYRLEFQINIIGYRK